VKKKTIQWAVYGIESIPKSTSYHAPLLSLIPQHLSKAEHFGPGQKLPPEILVLLL
jgi:hypothetical protein